MHSRRRQYRLSVGCCSVCFPVATEKNLHESLLQTCRRWLPGSKQTRFKVIFTFATEILWVKGNQAGVRGVVLCLKHCGGPSGSGLLPGNIMIFLLDTSMLNLRNRSALTVNCWVIIHCLEVSCKGDQITSATREWFICLQLTDKQWIITQQFTHQCWSMFRF